MRNFQDTKIISRRFLCNTIFFVSTIFFYDAFFGRVVWHGWTDGCLASVHVERIFKVEYVLLLEKQVAITWVHVFLIGSYRHTNPKKSRVDTVGIVTEKCKVWFSTGTRDFFLFQFIRPALGPTKPRIQWGSVFFYGLKRSGHDVDNSPPLNAELKNMWSYISIHPICLHDVEWDNLKFFLPYQTYWLRKKRCCRTQVK